MSDVPQGDGWWQASDGKWYPPTEVPAAAPVAAPVAAGAAAPAGQGVSVSVPLPALSTKLLGMLAWGVLALGVLCAFWIGFIAGPKDFEDKVAAFFSQLPGWTLTWAVLSVGSVLGSRSER